MPRAALHPKILILALHPKILSEAKLELAVGAIYSPERQFVRLATALHPKILILALRPKILILALHQNRFRALEPL